MNFGSRFYAETKESRRVLIIDPGMLGDTLHLMPAMRDLRTAYPKAEIHVICSPVGAEVHELCGFADKLWILPQGHAQRRVTDQLQTLLKLRRINFDVSLNIGTNDRNVVYAGIIGARMRLGLRKDRWHFWSSWCLPNWVTIPRQDLPAYELRRKMLQAAGFQLQPGTFELKIPEEASAWAASNVQDGALHLSINASTFLKEWPLANWIELVRILETGEKPMGIVATGSSNARDRKRLDTLASASRNMKIFVGLSIAQLAALLSRCALHLGADSGVLHLAAAMATPTISLFREYPGRGAWVPRGPQHSSLTVACDCIGNRHPPCSAQQSSSCLATISPATVLIALRKALKK